VDLQRRFDFLFFADIGIVVMERYINLQGTFPSLCDGDLVKSITGNGLAEFYRCVIQGNNVQFDRLEETDHRVGTRVVVREFRAASGESCVLKKAFCSKCSYLVAYEGHEDRCDNPQIKSDLVAKMKRRAWIGDALLMLDVRTALLADGTPDKDLTIVYSRCTKGSTLAELYVGYENVGVNFMFPALGRSPGQLATAFEANYLMVRDMYLKEHFPHMIGGGVQGEVLDAMRDGSNSAVLDTAVVPERKPGVIPV